MSALNRRQSFKVLLGGLLGAAGSVVLASTSLASRAAAEEVTPARDGAKDLEQRADRVAESNAPPEGATQQSVLFLNGAFRNAGGGGGFRNGGFANAGFRNAAFHNGGFANGGFRKAGFANGGFRD